MLMNHKNFHFTQISDKTNDVVFFKNPKTMFLGHFWSFLVIFGQWGFLPKNPAKFQKKTNEQIPRKLMDRRKGGRADEQILFYRTLTAKARGPKNNLKKYQ